MNALFQSRFGFHLYEYLLILEPVSDAQKQIRAFKDYFKKSHHYPNAIVSKAHITLMRFVQKFNFLGLPPQATQGRLFA